MSGRYRNNPDEIGEEYADVYLDDLSGSQNYNRNDPNDIQEEYADIYLTDLSSSVKNTTEAEYADVYDEKKASSSDDDHSGHGISNIGKNSSATKTRYPNKSKANVNPPSTSNKHSRKAKPKRNVSNVNVSTRSTSNKPSRKVQPRQRVESLKDEDNYDLPNEDHDEPNAPTPAITISQSTQKLVDDEKSKPGFTNKQCCLLVLGIFILNAGVTGGIYFAMFHNANESGKKRSFSNSYCARFKKSIFESTI